MNKIKKYCWSINDEEINCPETCDTVEECIDYARSQWLDHDEPFDVDYDDDRQSVFIDIYTTWKIDFTKMLQDFCDSLPDMVDAYMDDNYYLDETDFSLSDENREKIIATLNPILKSDCRFDYKADRWIGQYEITKDGYKLVAPKKKE